MMRVGTRDGRGGGGRAPSVGGEPAAAGRGRRVAGDEGGDLTGVEVRRHESGEGRGAELVQRGVPLEADLGAGEEAHRGDDADGAADDGQRAGAEGHLGEDAEDLLLVAAQRAGGPREGLDEERELFTEAVE